VRWLDRYTPRYASMGRLASSSIAAFANDRAVVDQRLHDLLHLPLHQRFS
jgi:hypothetical protein